MKDSELDEIFTPPNWMSDAAKAEFYKAYKMLKVQGTADPMDYNTLVDYSCALVELHELSARFQMDQEFTQPTANGSKASGLYALVVNRRDELRKLRQDLGFSVRQREGRWQVSKGTAKSLDKDDI